MYGLPILLILSRALSQWYFNPYTFIDNTTNDVEETADSIASVSESSSTSDSTDVSPVIVPDPITVDSDEGTLTVNAQYLQKRLLALKSSDTLKLSELKAADSESTSESNSKELEVELVVPIDVYAYKDTVSDITIALDLPFTISGQTDGKYNPYFAVKNTLFTFSSSVVVQNFRVGFTKDAQFKLTTKCDVKMENVHLSFTGTTEHSTKALFLIPKAALGGSLELTNCSVQQVTTTRPIMDTRYGSLKLTQTSFVHISLEPAEGSTAAAPLLQIETTKGGFATNSVSFHDVSSYGNGAVLRPQLYDKTHVLNITSTNFSLCGVRDGSGGALYVCAYEGDIVINNVTFSRCFSLSSSTSWFTNAVKKGQGSALYLDVRASDVDAINLNVEAVKVTAKKIAEPTLPDVSTDAADRGSGSSSSESEASKSESSQPSESSQSAVSSDAASSDESEETDTTSTIIFIAVNKEIAKAFQEKNVNSLDSLTNDTEGYNTDTQITTATVTVTEKKPEVVVVTSSQEGSTDTDDEEEEPDNYNTGDGSTAFSAEVETEESTRNIVESIRNEPDDEGFPGWAIALIVVFAVIIIVVILFAIMFLCRSQDEDETKDDKYEEDETEGDHTTHEMETMEPKVEHEKEEEDEDDDEVPAKEEETKEEEPTEEPTEEAGTEDE